MADEGGLLARWRANARVQKYESQLEEKAKQLNSVRRQANEVLKEETSLMGLAVGTAVAGGGGGLVALAEKWGPVVYENEYINVDTGHVVQLVSFGGAVLLGDRTLANVNKGSAGANVYRAVRSAISKL